MAIIWHVAGGFEKSVGTVRHCVFTAASAASAALLFLPLEAAWAGAGMGGVRGAGGFTPVALAMLAVASGRPRMRKAVVLGVAVPTGLVPWLLLGAARLLPGASLLADLCGLLVGVAFGHGPCARLDLPEAVASKLDRRFPFSLLGRVPGLRYVPGSSAERRAAQTGRTDPVPGSYPTRSYPSRPAPARPVVPLPPANVQRLAPWPSPGRPASGHVYVQNRWGVAPAPPGQCPAPPAWALPVFPAHPGPGRPEDEGRAVPGGPPPSAPAALPELRTL
ncbi:rhomboid domain-containing protein 2 [Ornithorhynchus anatinus]|nr:rhomboid domain-containing protein 2 [Ornithorhynchus anatinus]